MKKIPQEIIDKIMELNFICQYCNGKAKGEDAMRIAKLANDIIFYDIELIQEENLKKFGF